MMGESPATGASGRQRRVRPWLDFLFAFVCIFAGLSLPLPGLASLFVRAHAALGNALLPSTLASGVELSFRVTDELLRAQPWTLTLFVQSMTPASPITIPIDLRTLVYLPMACFVALALATPGGWPRRSLAVLGVGLALLEPLLLGLLALPLLSFLGGTGPVRAFTLGLGTHTVLQILYRALVASPGMAYVIPLLLWGALCAWLRFPKTEHSVRNSKSAPSPI
jgi:hypothetical protein